MSDFWLALARMLGRIIAITIVICFWALIIAFTLKVLWLIGFGM